MKLAFDFEYVIFHSSGCVELLLYLQGKYKVWYSKLDNITVLFYLFSKRINIAFSAVSFVANGNDA